MIANKHITAVVAVIVAVCMCSCFVALAYTGKLSEALGGGITWEYESKLFDTSQIISIDILMDESDWNEMLENAINEQYYQCDVKVNDTVFYGVGIRPKGNTSLSSIASDPDNNRYSFKLEFDYYVDGQTCFGLDKLILNNNFADATNMKEAVIYDMYSFLGADASLYNYADISVNGSYWGVYLALEAVEESFQLRNYGAQSGELYKPDSLGVGGAGNAGNAATDKKDSESVSGDTDTSSQNGNNQGGTPPEGFDSSSGNMPGTPPEGFDMSSGNMPGTPPGGFDSSSGNMPGTPPEGFDSSENSEASGESSTDAQNSSGESGSEKTTDGQASEKASAESGNMNSRGSGGGANLEYTDDELDSYSTIWDGSVTETSDSDRKRVVTALKNISEGNDLEKHLDVDNILKYMAVHSFAVNADSLSGNMAHNYYLYEYNGQLNILPWDYNLSFGGMGTGGESGASSVINDAIDTPFSGTTFFDALLENEEYLAKYHEYYRRLTEEYVDGGKFDSFYSGLRTQLDELVKTDPNAMYTYDEYLTAADMLYKTVKLRAESVNGQLNGSIPSTDEGQKADSSALIDASEIDIKSMGTFAGGNNSAGKTDTDSRDETEQTDKTEQTGATDEKQESGQTAQKPENTGSEQSVEQTTEESAEQTTEASAGQSGKQPGGQTAESSDGTGNFQKFGDGESFKMMSDFSGSTGAGTVSNLIWLAASAALAAVGLAVAFIFRERKRKR